MNGKSFKTSHERIVSEQFEDEVVVVNLDNGAYYSLRGTAERIWKWLQDGVPLEAITERLARQAPDAAARIEAEVAAFVGSLLDENLITGSDHPAAGLGALHRDAPAYATPLLEKFTDMQDLLLLDPIHDVDEAGWPRQLTEKASGASAGE